MNMVENVNKLNGFLNQGINWNDLFDREKQEDIYKYYDNDRYVDEAREVYKV